jgi:hypothetical protein
MMRRRASSSRPQRTILSFISSRAVLAAAQRGGQRAEGFLFGHHLRGVLNNTLALQKRTLP